MTQGSLQMVKAGGIYEYVTIPESWVGIKVGIGGTGIGGRMEGGWEGEDGMLGWNGRREEPKR